MYKITQEEFDKLPIINGIKQCPAYTDCSLITVFPSKCSFGYRCSFDDGCKFGERCRFGYGCSFGEGCKFASCCRFGVNCTFGESCRFGGYCNFCVLCTFGENCTFNPWCSFDMQCSFGDECEISGHILLDKFVRLVSGLGYSRGTLYAWNTRDGWYFQTCCQFSPEDEFRQAVIKKYGYQHAYLKAIDLLKEL